MNEQPKTFGAIKNMCQAWSSNLYVYEKIMPITVTCGSTQKSTKHTSFSACTTSFFKTLKTARRI